jgi:recombination protein RecT
MTSNAIQKAADAAKAPAEKTAKASINTMLNSVLDSEGYRKRFDELLGKRSPQFISSIISTVNADTNLQKAAIEAPQTIIQAGLKAAIYDLPIDPGLGYAYIVPFNNTIKLPDGGTRKRSEAAFIMGYKGMHQLALRTGVYAKINVVDVREGELKSYDRLTEDIEIEFVEDDSAREKLPIVGWCGYYRLLNGMEKTVYMTVEQIRAHELKNRKGQYMGKGWRENFEAMCQKTVYRRLIGKWGIMSIEYQKQATPQTLAIASAVAEGIDDEDKVIESEGYTVDEHTGEVVGEAPKEDKPEEAKE